MCDSTNNLWVILVLWIDKIIEAMIDLPLYQKASPPYSVFM